MPDYFSSYLKTYVERDIRVLGGIQDLNQFDRFVGIVAALTGQEINHSQLGRVLHHRTFIIGVRRVALKWILFWKWMANYFQSRLNVNQISVGTIFAVSSHSKQLIVMLN